MVAASCMCLCMSNNDAVGAEVAAIPLFLGGFMVSNTAYHFVRLKWKEWR